MRKIAVAVALSLMSAAAFAQDVKVDFDKSANFGAIKTFTVKIGTSWNNQISEKRITAEIEQTLTEKGWTKTDANPDALVLLHGATEKQKSLNTFYSGGYGGYGYRGPGRHGWDGQRHHDGLRVHRGHPGRGYLRREDEGTPLPGDGRRTRSRTSPRRTSRRSRRPAEDVQGLSPGIEGEEVAHEGTAAGRKRRYMVRASIGLPLLAAVLFLAAPSGSWPRRRR